jgi:hypothetical protein
VELAIVNLSNTVLALQLFRLAPGACVKLTDYYNSEQDAKRDKIVAKLLSKGKLAFRMVNFDGIHNLDKTILDVEERAAEQRKEEQAARFARDAAYRNDRKQRRNVTLTQRKVERAQREAEASAQASMDLGILYEQQRKQRLIRMMDERQRAILADDAPPEAKVDPLEPQPEFVEPDPVPSEEPVADFEAVEMPEAVAEEALSELQDEEVLDSSDWMQEADGTEVAKLFEEGSVFPEAVLQEPEPELSAEDMLESMPITKLRDILKSHGSETKSRKRSVLLSAVRELGLSAEELSKTSQPE